MSDFSKKTSDPFNREIMIVVKIGLVVFFSGIIVSSLIFMSFSSFSIIMIAILFCLFILYLYLINQYNFFLMVSRYVDKPVFDLKERYAYLVSNLLNEKNLKELKQLDSLILSCAEKIGIDKTNKPKDFKPVMLTVHSYLMNDFFEKDLEKIYMIESFFNNEIYDAYKIGDLIDFNKHLNINTNSSN